MASPPRKLTGLTRRKLGFYLTIIKPKDLQSSPADRYAYRETLGTRDEAVARIKALAIRADLEAQWEAERERRKPRPAMLATTALVDTLLGKLRHELLSADDLNGMSLHPLAHLPGLPDELLVFDEDPSVRWAQVISSADAYAEQMVFFLATRDTAHFERLLAYTLKDTGLPELDFDTDPTPFMRWCRGVVQLFKDIAGRAKGDTIETPEPVVLAVNSAAPAPMPQVTAGGPGMQDLFEDWKAIKTRNRPAIKITERALGIMAEVGIDVPLAQLDRSHGAKLRAHLVAQGLRGQSVKNLIAPLQALLNVGVDNGKLKANPWQGLKIDTSDSVERRPWRLEDLKKLAEANAKRTDTHAERHRWLFPLLLHTGCRIGEVAQLELADVALIDGHWAIDIHDRRSEGHDKRSVKTKAGNRIVPIHPVLVAMGFLAHVEVLRAAGERFLFPAFIQAGKRLPSEIAGRDFLALRKDAGVPIEEFWTAHSLRHNVRSALVAANVNETLIDLTIGHEDGSVQQRYSHAQMPGLVRTIEALDWSAVGYAFKRNQCEAA